VACVCPLGFGETFWQRNGHPRPRAEPERKLLGLIESVVAGPTWEGATKLSASDRDPLPNHRHIGPLR
jgi:hypothetical protein